MVNTFKHIANILTNFDIEIAKLSDCMIIQTFLFGISVMC